MIGHVIEEARAIVRSQGYLKVITSAGPGQVSTPRVFRRGQFADMVLFLDWAQGEGLDILFGLPGLDGGSADGC